MYVNLSLKWTCIYDPDIFPHRFVNSGSLIFPQGIENFEYVYTQ